MDTDIFSLSGKTALITGGSAGLGRNFAFVLAEAGAKVGLIARGQERLEKTTKQLQEKGYVAQDFVCDVSKADEVRKCIEKVNSAFGKVDILVNDAGTCVFKDTFDYKPQDWDVVLNTNLKGVWLMCQNIIGQMVERNTKGSIINISSIFATRSASGSDHAYPASKAAVEQLTRSLAIEFAPSKIRVNAIAPGWFPTDFNREFLESNAGREIIKNKVPLKRTGLHKELDTALLYLASDASSYTTGTILHVDGGLVAMNI